MLTDVDVLWGSWGTQGWFCVSSMCETKAWKSLTDNLSPQPLLSGLEQNCYACFVWRYLLLNDAFRENSAYTQTSVVPSIMSPGRNGYLESQRSQCMWLGAVLLLHGLVASFVSNCSGTHGSLREFLACSEHQPHAKCLLTSWEHCTANFIDQAKLAEGDTPGPWDTWHVKNWRNAYMEGDPTQPVPPCRP